MNRIFQYTFRGAVHWTVFAHAMVRRKLGRKFMIVPRGECRMFDLEQWEIGQLMGGN